MLILGGILLAAAALAFAVALWNVLAWPSVSEAPAAETDQVAVLIPARDEEPTIDACIQSALAQGGVLKEVLVYDDHSTDATASRVRTWSARDDRVRLCAPVPLPPGWYGKPFACARLAGEATAPWLLFLDADARLQPAAADRLLTEARQRDATLLAPWPDIVCGGFWEKALMPLLNFCVFSFFPAPLALRRNDPSLGLAHGACILVEAATYRAAGGHAMVQDEIFEDTWLARRWREAGHVGVCLDGRTVVKVRMYQSFSGIWFGFMKNFRPAFRGEARFWAFWAFHGICFLLPFLLLPVAVWRVDGLPVVAATALVLTSRLLMARRFGHPWWSAAFHPVAEALLLALGVASWRRWKSGVGVQWKGRTYQPSQYETERPMDSEDPSRVE